MMFSRLPTAEHCSGNANGGCTAEASLWLVVAATVAVGVAAAVAAVAAVAGNGGGRGHRMPQTMQMMIERLTICHRRGCKRE